MNADPSHHRQLVARGALLLDVRTPGEFHQGHLAHAVNVPVQELAARLPDLGPVTRPVVVYCRSGGRSAMAAQLLTQAGYRVKDLGPMTAW